MEDFNTVGCSALTREIQPPLSVQMCGYCVRRRRGLEPATVTSARAVFLAVLVAFGGLVNTVSANSNNLGTLKTFQANACDDEMLNIKCPQGTTISVHLVQYGKQVTNPCESPSTADGVQVQEHDNTSCLASGSLQYDLLQVVVQQCQEKRQCEVAVAPSTFGTDPCPGIRKYVEVTYKCRPNEFITKVICEGEQLHLKCRKFWSIAIYSANFGRLKNSNVECPQPDGVAEEECQASYATEAVMGMCHGKRKCTMMADIGTFGNPCVMKSRRYLKVVYTCVPTKILMTKFQGVGTGEDYEGETESEKDVYDDFVEEPGYKTPQAKKEGGDHDRHSVKSSKEATKKTEEVKGKPSSDSLFPTNSILTTKDVQGDTSGEDNSTGTGAENSSQANCTVPENSSGDDASVGVIKEWITAFNFLRGNTEKLILYLTVSIAAGLVVLMLVVIIRLMIQKRREHKRAKLNISEPLPNGFGDDMSDIDQDITDLSHSSPPRQDPSVAVVRYTSRSTMRRQDSDTNPRAPITNRGQNNFYYS